MRPAMATARWISVGLLGLAAVSGAALWLQRQAAADLRDEIALLRGDQRELARLRVENQRLSAAQPATGEVERLRADRAAVGRLRAEIETTRSNLEARERALAAPPKIEPARPALVATIGLGADGTLTSNGQRFEPGQLRQQLAALPRGSAFEIRLQLPRMEADGAFEQVKQAIETVSEPAKQAAKEFGLRMTMRTVRTEPAQN